MMSDSELSTEFTEIALLPLHLAVTSMALTWRATANLCLPYRFHRCWHEEHEQLVMPKPLEAASECNLFA